MASKLRSVPITTGGAFLVNVTNFPTMSKNCPIPKLKTFIGEHKFVVIATGNIYLVDEYVFNQCDPIPVATFLD